MSDVYKSINSAQERARILAEKLGVEFDPPKPPSIEDVEINTDAWLAYNEDRELIEQTIENFKKKKGQ